MENADAVSTVTANGGGIDRIEEKKEPGIAIINKSVNAATATTTTSSMTVVAPIVASRNRRVRKNLKKSMAQLRGSLTAHETKFLQGLLDTGTDQEIQAATRTIVQHPSLFLISSPQTKDNEFEIVLNSESSEQKDLSKQQHEESHHDRAALSNNRAAASSFSSSHSSASEQRREQRLEVRRSFAVYDQVWKAYEEGTLQAAAGATTTSSAGGNDGGRTLKSSSNSAPADFRSSLLKGVVRHGGHHDARLNVVGINHASPSAGRRLSCSVTAAKVHRMTVTSSLVTRKSSSMVSRRRSSSNFRTSSSSSISAVSTTEQQLARNRDLKTGSTRRKSVSFSDPKEEQQQDKKDVHEKRTWLLEKEIKPCLVKKKLSGEEEHICESSSKKVTILTPQQQQKQQGATNSFCNINCLPLGQFFARFRRVSITTDVQNDTRVSKAMPEMTVKDRQEDDCSSSKIDIPASTARIVRIRGDSFDETLSCERVSAVLARQRTNSSVSRNGLLKRTFSDDCLHSNSSHASPSHGAISSEQPDTANDNDDDENNDVLDYYDVWLNHVQGGDLAEGADNDYSTHLKPPPPLDFLIIGSSANDTRALPHVLSPPLMQSLQAYLPWNKRGENFWLKYSLVRDGACMITLLQACRGAKYSFLAIETIGGDVFGAFCGKPWRKSGGGHYGSAESFIWKMKHARKEQARSVLDQAAMEREIEVYPYSHNNDFIQVCKNDRLSVGGGTGDTIDTYTILPDFAEDSQVEYHDWGPAIYLTKTLLQGTSSPCLTFCSPALCPRHEDGSLFEIINLEVWTLTPAINLEQAEQVECGQLFFTEHSQFIKKQ
jgi:TLD